VVILGAGLAGLSAAYHLQQAGVPCGLYERESEIGGLCRSVQRQGFTFDHTGHLMHFRRPEVKALVESLMGGELVAHQRRAAIYSHGVFTDYPFQANIFGLPMDVVQECLLGFIEAWGQRAGRGAAPTPPKHFLQWVQQTFGRGIARHFMIPFNEKLWLRPLSRLGCDWGGGWLIPVPTLAEVVGGALGVTNRNMGYNPSFFYPKAGGIQRYPAAFGGRLRQIHLGHEMTAVDLRRRTVHFRNGLTVRYRRLISTLPLPELARRATGLEAAVRRSAARLSYVSVTNVNLGVARQGVSPYHWVYFPEPRFPFYRVGFPSNLSETAAPPGQSLISIEFSHLPGQPPAPRPAIGLAVDGLRAAGLLRADDRLTLQEVIEIPYAYVIFDQWRGRSLPAILRALRRFGVASIGRYGAWEHSSMEDAVWQGKRAAEAR
jgi:protoporphyrinogen oxidase